jgi:hypothetical protein
MGTALGRGRVTTNINLNVARGFASRTTEPNRRPTRSTSPVRAGNPATANRATQARHAGRYMLLPGLLQLPLDHLVWISIIRSDVFRYEERPHMAFVIKGH